MSYEIIAVSSALNSFKYYFLFFHKKKKKRTIPKVETCLNDLFSLWFLGFGLPPTPPSSLPSDDSEGNQSPEHNTSTSSSPMSPSQQQQQAHHQQTAAISPNNRRVSMQQQNSHSNVNGSTRGYTGSSSRQPIHTPLISSQPVILHVTNSGPILDFIRSLTLSLLDRF